MTFTQVARYPTMRDLERMDDQAIFDYVARHLLTQGRRATPVEGIGCLYRGPDGRSCAIGCLIPAEYYHPVIEGIGVRDLTGRLLCGVPSLGRWFADHLALLVSLQGIHDTISPAEWGEALRYLAWTMDLNDAMLTHYAPPFERASIFDPRNLPAWWPSGIAIEEPEFAEVKPSSGKTVHVLEESEAA
jgi:hypothetical protein